MSDFNTPMPPPPPGYGESPYGGAPQEHPQAGTIFILGIVSLVLGAIGVFCCAFLGLLGIAPLIMSGKASREIAASGGTLGGASKVKNGRTMGIIAICLAAFALVLNIILFSTGAMDGFMKGYQS
ncbi:DUF4190 domain-containing protein [Nocardioides cavernaquae]|nr:DUF4190 domain-containing protein [Nocardioides cavernaquae]